MHMESGREKTTREDTKMGISLFALPAAISPDETAPKSRKPLPSNGDHSSQHDELPTFSIMSFNIVGPNSAQRYTTK